MILKLGHSNDCYRGSFIVKHSQIRLTWPWSRLQSQGCQKS